MSIIRTEITYVPIHQVEIEQLLCPLSETIEPMRLQLFQKHTSNWAIKKTTKQISGVFFQTTTNNEVPFNKWTSEMKTFFNEQKKKAPTQPNLQIFTKFGKIFFLFAVVLFGYCISSLCMIIYKNKDTSSQFNAELKMPPEAYNYYFGELKQYNKTRTIWVQVASVKSDSVILKLCSKYERGYLPTVESKEYHAYFDKNQTIFKGNRFEFIPKKKDK